MDLEHHAALLEGVLDGNQAMFYVTRPSPKRRDNLQKKNQKIKVIAVIKQRNGCAPNNSRKPNSNTP
jgi:hypothetical protein